jgi:hypothetical protein
MAYTAMSSHTICAQSPATVSRQWNAELDRRNAQCIERLKEKSKMKTPPMAAILALVRYLEADERKHFESKWMAGEDTSRHIFNDIKIVSDWLDGQPGIPTAAERERQRLALIEKAFAQHGVAMDGDFADFWRASDEKEVN